MFIEGGRKVHHNVSYRTWYMKRKLAFNPFMKVNQASKELTMMVRCKIDGCEVSNRNCD